MNDMDKLRQRMADLEERVKNLEEKSKEHDDRISWLEGVEKAFSEVFSTIAGIFKSAGKAGKSEK